MNTLKVRFFGALLLVANVVPSLAYSDEHSLKRADGSEIVFQINNRSSDQKQGLLLVLQGSDCNSVITNPVVAELANTAPERAVLMIEKYGLTSDLPRITGERTDCPKTYLMNDKPSRRTLDGLTVLSHLRQNAKWWNGDLVIIGGSEGALVAESIAHLAPETSGLVIFGFGSRQFEDDLLFSIKVSLEQGGLPEEEQKKVLGQIKGQFDKARHAKAADQEMSGHSHAYWAEMLAIDQLQLLGRLKMPVLALHGDADTAASARGAEALVDAAKARGARIDFVLYDGLDHGFRQKGGQSDLIDVIKDIRSWLEHGTK